MEKKYKLFVVFHQNLNNEYYRNELLNNYTFVNVNPKNNLQLINDKYKIINQYEFSDFHPLGKWYTESEVIYNIYKNKQYHEHLDFVGFSQYDIDSSPLFKEDLESKLGEFDHINFEPHLFQVDYNQGILMDISQPEKRNGKGLNCYDVILNDYNKYYGTTYSIDDLNDKVLNLCSAFILKKEYFIKMMDFISQIIESGKLDKFDVSRQHRMQGGYLERYYAVWIALNNLNSTEIKLKHIYAETTIQNSLFNRILRKIGVK